MNRLADHAEFAFVGMSGEIGWLRAISTIQPRAPGCTLVPASKLDFIRRSQEGGV